MSIVSLLSGIFILSCEADQVGYLITHHARYAPDTVVFQSVLNPDNPADARRIEFEIPWQSPDIQGIEGTLPRSYRLLRMECDNYHPEAVSQFRISDINAVIQLPYNHTVPPGRYVFSIEISNENRRNIRQVNSALTIIIE